MHQNPSEQREDSQFTGCLWGVELAERKTHRSSGRTGKLPAHFVRMCQTSLLSDKITHKST